MDATVLAPIGIIMVAVVVAVGGIALARAWGYRVGGRRFDSHADFVDSVASWTGLAGGPRELGWFGSLADVVFEGRLATGRSARIRYVAHVHSTGKSAYTTFTVHMGVSADRTAQLEVSLENVFSRLGEWLGLLAKVPTGKQAFDRRYRVTSVDGVRTRNALGRGLDSLIHCIFSSFGAERLAAGRGWLEATMQAASLDPHHYREALALLDEAAQAMERTPLRVRVLGGERRALRDASGATRCAYCHGGITGDEDALVACAQCRTVLHEDCWNEAARCPTLGCPSTVVERPGSRSDLARRTVT